MKKEKTWIIKIIILSFTISFIFSLASESIMPKVPLIASIVILIIFILIGIIFDMIGVAITTCDIKPFHSMNSKRISYAKTAINLLNKREQVSSFCNDVIGDICGIVSGSAGVIIATTISTKLNINPLITTLVTTSIIAALTIGGKSIGKRTAIKNNTMIIKIFSKIIHTFKKRNFEKNKK